MKNYNYISIHEKTKPIIEELYNKIDAEYNLKDNEIVKDVIISEFRHTMPKNMKKYGKENGLFGFFYPEKTREIHLITEGVESFFEKYCEEIDEFFKVKGTKLKFTRDFELFMKIAFYHELGHAIEPERSKEDRGSEEDLIENNFKNSIKNIENPTSDELKTLTNYIDKKCRIYSEEELYSYYWGLKLIEKYEEGNEKLILFYKYFVVRKLEVSDKAKYKLNLYQNIMKKHNTELQDKSEKVKKDVLEGFYNEYNRIESKISEWFNKVTENHPKINKSKISI